MATKDKQPDVKIYVRSDRKRVEPTQPPEEAQFPMVLRDDREIEKLYQASEANSYLNDQLLEQDELTGEIRSQVVNVVPDGDFDPEKPVMPRSQRRTMNTFESLIPELERQALVEAGTMGADFFDSTVNIIGGSLEDAVHNSLKYFYSLTPDSFQKVFKESMFGQRGGLAGITGTEEQFDQTRVFPHVGGIVEEVARAIGSFAWGMKGAGIVLNTKKAMLARGAISDMTVFNPDDGNLATLIREFDLGPEVLQDVVAYIDSTEPGTATEKRVRMAAEGIILTFVIAGAMKSPQAAREVKEWAKTFFGENGTGKPAVDAVARLLSEMKKKWPSDSSFADYLGKHLGNERGAVGKPKSAPIKTNTKEFKKWFKGSKVVDEQGNPLVVYHGTPYDIKGAFDTPAYFASDPKFASKFTMVEESYSIEELADMAKDFPDVEFSPQMNPVYLSIKNPKLVDGLDDRLFEKWQKQGYDGVIKSDGSVYVAFNPEQIKSQFGPEPTTKPKKKTKVKKLSRTEETGSLNTIYPEVNQGMEESMSRMDPAEAKMLRENMEKHAGTPWAAATSRGLTIREFFHRAMEGRMDEAMGLANSKLWGKDSLVKYEMGKAFMHSKEAVLEFAQSYSFIGKNRKAELDISGSFKNCNPSGDCAKFCYASIANARPAELMKAEFTEWVAENHPEILAKRVGALYSATPQGMTGLALRINDKGDLSNGQVELIKAMNKQGHRIQIFSKRPDMLAKVPDENLKMLSIDSTNFELTRKHPEYQLAVTITDDMTPEMIAEINDRVAVYLPVNMKGGEVTRADVQKRFPNSFKKMTKKLCPVDGGKMKTKPGTSFVNIANKTAEPGLWTCTACDKFGAAGCFYGKNQTENVKKINNQMKQANK